MGRVQIEILEGSHIYACTTCGTHLTTYNELISKAFRGRGGKAYLFNNVLNITCGPLEDRVLLTGLHTVCDVFCKGCHSNVGWKYEKAVEPSQKYKEGKVILEKIQIKKEYWST